MANEAYMVAGTNVLFATSQDVAFGVEGLLDGDAQVSTQKAWAASPRPVIYHWSCECQWQATPGAGSTLDLYLAGAPDHDNTQIDGDVALTDTNYTIAADVDESKNMMYIGSVVSVAATASIKCVASGFVTFLPRYMSVFAVNNGGATINATASNFRFNITPYHWQGQG